MSDHHETESTPDDATSPLHAAVSAARRPRVCVVTGASSGIGRATAIRFARAGDHVVLVARRRSELERTRELCGGNGRVVVCDVARPADIRALAASIAEVEGHCDVLVANAGVGSRAAFDGPGALTDFDRIIDTNLRGVAGCVAELLPLLSKSSRASVVTVSSVAGLFGTPNAPAYSASKFGVTGLTEALAPTLAARGIIMSCVQPGPVPTEGWPHERIAGRWYGRILAADVDDVARVIDKCTHASRPRSVVIPRIYRAVHVLRTLVPPLWRMVQKRVVSSNARHRDHQQPPTTPPSA